MQAALQRSPQRIGWTAVATALGIAIVAGASIAVTAQCLRSSHQRSLRLREAKKRYRQLVAELSECKGILNYMDTEAMPEAQRLADEAHELSTKADGVLAGAALARVEAIHRELMLTGERLLQLMEKIDGVAPALVLDAAQVEPWAEHDEKLKTKYMREGLGAAFELAGDLRAIRKGMARKADRRAQAIDKLKSSVRRLTEPPESVSVL
ncbi:hypothetical protein GGH95_004663 [Coemansia sp. RSA 1836]|nr:hypothetical protein GGH95_004663 [Coemansia sp. RSA 1836]